MIAHGTILVVMIGDGAIVRCALWARGIWAISRNCCASSCLSATMMANMSRISIHITRAYSRDHRPELESYNNKNQTDIPLKKRRNRTWKWCFSARLWGFVARIKRELRRHFTADGVNQIFAMLIRVHKWLAVVGWRPLKKLPNSKKKQKKKPCQNFIVCDFFNYACLPKGHVVLDWLFVAHNFSEC